MYRQGMPSPFITEGLFHLFGAWHIQSRNKLLWHIFLVAPQCRQALWIYLWAPEHWFINSSVLPSWLSKLHLPAHHTTARSFPAHSCSSQVLQAAGNPASAMPVCVPSSWKALKTVHHYCPKCQNKATWRETENAVWLKNSESHILTYQSLQAATKPLEHWGFWLYYANIFAL